MNPRKVNTFFAEIALEHSVTEDIVDDVISFYWKEVEHNIAHPDYPNLKVDGFGNFEMRRKMLEYQIQKQENILKRMKISTYGHHQISSDIIKKVTNLQDMLELLKKQEGKKQSIRLKQNGKSI